MQRILIIFTVSFLVYGCASLEVLSREKKENMDNKIITINPKCTKYLGAIVRGPQDEKKLALVYTGGSFADTGNSILDTLKENNIKASFFFTGEFFRYPEFAPIIQRIVNEGHYISIHSNAHLLYCPWDDRTKTLVTKEEFVSDLEKNFEELAKFGVKRENARFWIPPYEWYNETISQWSDEMGLIIINLTRGTLSSTDYTLDKDKNFRSNQVIYDSIIKKEQTEGLNGFLLLMHIGSSSERSEKFATRLPELIKYLKEKQYTFHRVDELLTVK